MVNKNIQRQYFQKKKTSLGFVGVQNWYFNRRKYKIQKLNSEHCKILRERKEWGVVGARRENSDRLKSSDGDTGNELKSLWRKERMQRAAVGNESRLSSQWKHRLSPTSLANCVHMAWHKPGFYFFLFIFFLGGGGGCGTQVEVLPHWPHIWLHLTNLKTLHTSFTPTRIPSQKWHQRPGGEGTVWWVGCDPPATPRGSREMTRRLLWVRDDEPESLGSPSRGRQLEGDELLESLQVLSVQFDVVVAGSLHPQGLDGAGATLVHGQAVGEVDDLVLSAVNHQHWWRHLGHLVNAGGETDGMALRMGKFWGRFKHLVLKTFLAFSKKRNPFYVVAASEN